MMLPALLALAVCSPTHAFERLPAASEVQTLLTAVRAASIGARPVLPLAVVAGPAGLDAVFAPAGAAGNIDGGRSGARGTYTVNARAADRVQIGLVADLGANHIVATLTLSRQGSNATLQFAGVVTTPSDPSEPPMNIDNTARGSYTFDPATGTGTISYEADGQRRTETFSQTPTGMRMTLMGMPHTFTRTR